MDDGTPEPFAAQQTLLRGRLLGMLGTIPSPLRADVEIALQGRGKLLSEPQPPSSLRPAGMWPLLTLLIAQALDPDIDLASASGAAVSIECMICALDVLDDIEDGDRTPTLAVLGEKRALNVATTLLLLSYATLLSCESAAEALLSHLQMLTASVLEAAAGQHLDLLADQRLGTALSEDSCFEIAALKAGSLMALVCRMGALCAGATALVCDDFTQLGRLLGIAHQLDNDAHDLYRSLQETSTDPAKSDIVRQQTLPFALAAQIRLQNKAERADTSTRAEDLDALNQGMLETWGLGMLYRERAHALAHSLAEQGLLSPQLLLLLGLGEQERKEDETRIHDG